VTVLSLDQTFRGLFRTLMACEPGAAGVLADFLGEAGDPREEQVRSFRWDFKGFVKLVHDRRKQKTRNPSGTFRGQCWYPTPEEDCGDVVGRSREPTANGSHPLSYLTRCRTKSHCEVLCRAAMLSRQVPPDVSLAYQEVIIAQQEWLLSLFPEVRRDEPWRPKLYA
jgi:hypothetical protein